MFLRKLCKNPTEIKKENSNLLKSFSFLIDSYSYLIEWLSTENKPKEAFLKVFFTNAYLFSILFFKQISNVFNEVFNFNNEKSIARLLYSWITLQRTLYKTKSLDLTTLYNEIFSNFPSWLACSSDHIKSLYFVEKKTNKPIYILQICIDFMMQEYESTLQPNPILVRRILDSLLNLVKCFPSHINDLYKGEEYYYMNYDGLLNKLLKLAIDCQDVESKENLIKCLKILCRKTPMNFRILIQAASYNKQHSRLELLQKIEEI